MTENPGDYFALEERAVGELNLRKQWMARYIHDQDWSLLQLTENPYCEGVWRRFEGWSVPRMDAPYLRGSGGPVWYARDNEHGWFYHVDEAYNLTGNPWIKDWYRFIAEFRRTSLERLDPVPDRSSRALGHSLNHALQAYKATGDMGILTRFRDHIRNFLRPDQDPG